jgi:glycosyltransferase involved in cell wall biosynthesis
VILDSSEKTIFEEVQRAIRKMSTGHEKPVQVLLSASKSGAAATRNVGIRRSVGDFIAFLDDDDEYVESKLALQLEQMRRSAADFSHTDYLRTRDGVTRYIKTNNSSASRTARTAAYGRCRIATPCVMVNGQIARSLDCFFPEIDSDRVMEDQQGWVKFLCRSNATVLHIPLALTRVHVNEHSSSRLSFERQRALVRRDSLREKVEVAKSLGIKPNWSDKLSLFSQFALIKCVIVFSSKS